MENATAADSSQSNISRLYIWKDKKKSKNKKKNKERTYDGKSLDKRETIDVNATDDKNLDKREQKSRQKRNQEQKSLQKRKLQKSRQKKNNDTDGNQYQWIKKELTMAKVSTKEKLLTLTLLVTKISTISIERTYGGKSLDKRETIDVDDDKKQKDTLKSIDKRETIDVNAITTSPFSKILICLFKKLLFTMENATAADSSQSNISRLYIWKDKKKSKNKKKNKERTYDGKSLDKRETIDVNATDDKNLDKREQKSRQKRNQEQRSLQKRQDKTTKKCSTQLKFWQR